ncbi:MAG TPA: NAD(P)/FAD-dependent oxidoreductase, partial [Catalimonadaceae bacterium]|nr:NAD(P)/FAD-dependent oxidoreductase [Catalimonadaceae bacterium]
MKDLVIIGGGAAGFFAASEVLRRKPHASVVILEKTGKVLAKVKISGGGRCNVTHHCFEPEKLIEFYPRGNPWLQDVFRKFQVRDTLRWFQDLG